MLDRYTDALMFETKDAADFRVAPEQDDREAWAAVPEGERREVLRRAEEYLREGTVPPLTASAYMAYRRNRDLSGYPGAYARRRDMLRTLTLAVCLRPGGEFDQLLSDLVWAVCEETSWVLPGNNPCALGRDAELLPDPHTPLVDRAAAETAADLALMVRMIGRQLEEITPQLVRRVIYEVTTRVIEPLATYRELEWMCGSHGETIRCLSGCLMAVLSLEEDSRRRWACVRKCWLLLDRELSLLPADGSIPEGISSGWLETAEPVVDCLMMVYYASRGKVDVRGEQQLQLMCHYPVLCHMALGWFVNPGRESMRPMLDAEAMLRIGLDMRDTALCDLAAFLAKSGQSAREEERTLWHEVIRLFQSERLENAEIRPPFRREGYLPGAQMMTARMAEDDSSGLAIAMHGGSNGRVDGHADVGDILLFAGDKPVLVDGAARPGSAWHSLPAVGGVEQALGAAYRAQDVSCEMEEDYALMSMNLALAYPEQACIYSWQRTFILSRDEESAQLVEAFDLEGFHSVEFHFTLGVEPRLGPDYAQIGPVRMRWDGSLLSRVEEAEALPGMPEGGVYRLTLTTPEPVDGGQYAFVFNALRTFG